MQACNKVMPFPCLARQECDAAYNRPAKPFDNTFFIAFMSCMHGQYHRNRADDENKSHYTHKSQGQISVTRTGKRIEYYVRIGPEILTKADASIRYKESAECKGITHQEVPHHQFAIFQVKWAFASTPPFWLLRCSCCICLLYTSDAADERSSVDLGGRRIIK